jgi:hypothetical protein
MRNYCRIYCARLNRYNSGGGYVNSSVYFGQNSAEQAIALANSFGNAWLQQNPGATYSVNDLFRRYILLNQGLITSYFVLLSQDRDAGEYLIFKIEDFAAGFGVDAKISPKAQDVAPWNGKPERS